MPDFFDLTNIIQNQSDGKFLSVSIGVVSTGYLTAQQKCIMMTYQKLNEMKLDRHVVIVSCYLYEGFFKEFVIRSKGLEQVRSYSPGLDFIDWNYYLNSNDHQRLIEMVKDYDVILWDLPEVELIKKWENKFSHYFSQIDQLSILSVNTKKNSDETFYKETKDYFSLHGFPFQEHSMNKNSTKEINKNSWVRAFRRIFDNEI